MNVVDLLVFTIVVLIACFVILILVLRYIIMEKNKMIRELVAREFITYEEALKIKDQKLRKELMTLCRDRDGDT